MTESISVDVEPAPDLVTEPAWCVVAVDGEAFAGEMRGMAVELPRADAHSRAEITVRLLVDRKHVPQALAALSRAQRT